MRRVLLAAGAVLVVLAGVAAFVLWPRGATPVSEEDALADFRARELDDTAGPDGGVPDDGVYTYAAEGGEDAKLGVLPTEHRDLPDQVTAVVVAEDDGCFAFDLNLFAQHTETTRWCGTERGDLVLDAHVKHQQLGSLEPEATMACDPATVVDAERRSTSLTCTLELDGGPAALSADLDGTAVRGEATSVEVEGEAVEVVAVEVSFDVSGDLTGSWEERLWFDAETWLPVRIERALQLDGLATFDERSSLSLVSLDPSR